MAKQIETAVVRAIRGFEFRTTVAKMFSGWSKRRHQSWNRTFTGSQLIRHACHSAILP